MKFNVDLADDIKEYLEKQYKDYLKKRTMTKKEQRAVREWVKNGNSVYDNPDGAWLDGQVRMDFLDTYRDDEYIRQHTKGMTSEERRQFALAYYGWDDEPEPGRSVDCKAYENDFLPIDNEAMPFV